MSDASPWLVRWAHLWRPLWDDVVAAVGTNGVLLYETFAVGNATVGRPANPDFLLAHGELLAVAAGLRIVAYEDGFLADPDRFVQRVAAVREVASARPRRHSLDGSGSNAGSVESTG